MSPQVPQYEAKARKPQITNRDPPKALIKSVASKCSLSSPNTTTFKDRHRAAPEAPCVHSNSVKKM